MLTRVHDAIAAPLEFSPVFQRGGSIVPRKNRVRRSSKLMVHDPYTLTVALDALSRASGELYVDDEHTFAFANEHKYTQVALSASLQGVSGVVTHGRFAAAAWIERIDVYGFQGAHLPTRVVRKGDGSALEFSYHAATDCLTIRKPAVKATESWEIAFL